MYILTSTYFIARVKEIKKQKIKDKQTQVMKECSTWPCRLPLNCMWYDSWLQQNPRNLKAWFTWEKMSTWFTRTQLPCTRGLWTTFSSNLYSVILVISLQLFLIYKWAIKLFGPNPLLSMRSVKNCHRGKHQLPHSLGTASPAGSSPSPRHHQRGS